MEYISKNKRILKNQINLYILILLATNICILIGKYLSISFKLYSIIITISLKKLNNIFQRIREFLRFKKKKLIKFSISDTFSQCLQPDRFTNES